jgi:hypothetical protein
MGFLFPLSRTVDGQSSVCGGMPALACGDVPSVHARWPRGL